MATGLGRIAIAAQVLADGLADARAAGLAQLLGQLIQPPLQFGFDANTQGHGLACGTDCSTLARIGSRGASACLRGKHLQQHGIGAISRALEHEREVGLSVRGELRYVVMEADAYQRLRECELEIALQEARADLAAGRVVHESVDDHIKRLEALAIGPEDELQAARSQP